MTNYRGRRDGAKGKVRNRRTNLQAPEKTQSSQEEEDDRPIAPVIDIRTARRPE